MDSNRLLQKNIPHKTSGQALVEFTLILPLLLLILLGIIDYGRILFIYSSVSSAIRDGARNAEILGVDDNGIPTYASCDLIRSKATNTFLQNVADSDVSVQYYSTGREESIATLEKYAFYTRDDVVFQDDYTQIQSLAASEGITLKSGASSWRDLADYDCDNNDTVVPNVEDHIDEIHTGDIMLVTIQTNVVFMTPILSNMFPSLTLNFRAQRSIVTNLEIIPTLEDVDGDSLDDDWELLNFGCMASPDYAGGAYEDLVIRPNGLIVDPETHAAISPETYVSEINSYPSPASLYFKFWAKEVCDMEDRDASLYPDSAWGWTTTDVGCVATDDPEVFSCPVPALIEFSSADDPDGDGCQNGCEEITGGLPIEGAGSISAIDSDGDGLTDGEEVKTYGTSPTNPDTDGDGIWDGDEVKLYFTNPKLADSDGDGLSDLEEFNYEDPVSGDKLILSNADGEYLEDANGNKIIDPNTNDYIVDTTKLGGNDTDADNDGISDYDEVKTGYSFTLNINGTSKPISGHTDPMKTDTDGDGISDYDEINGLPLWIGSVVKLDPNNPDTDGDGIPDGVEYQNYIDNGQSESSPNFSSPYSNDTDGDGLTDDKEVPLADGGYGTYPNDANSDAASEGCLGIDDTPHYLNDKQESTGVLVQQAGLGLNPDGDAYANGNDDDSDGDTLSDCDEVFLYGTNPYTSDTDGDTVSDLDEVNCPILSPVLADTNGDGINDTQADADTCDTSNTDAGPDEHLPDIWEGQFGFGCIYTVGSADLLRPDGTPVDMDTSPATLLSPKVSYPDSCDGYTASNPVTQPYLAQNDKGDPDLDGCNNLCEYQRHTDPLDPDTDDDGLKDGAETTTSPLIADTDGDGLEDGQEANPNNMADVGKQYYNSDPLDKDTDNDGLEDGLEASITDSSTGEVLALSNADCDIDNDGSYYPTDTTGENAALCDNIAGIRDADTDGDGLSDYDEVTIGYSLNLTINGTSTTISGHTNPMEYDSDGDGLSDYEEIFISGTLPQNNDTDGDGLKDGEEVNTYGTDPLNSDTDSDGLTDSEEVNGFDMLIQLASGGTVTTIPGWADTTTTAKLNPNKSDSDKDNLSDGDEVYYQDIMAGNAPANKDGTNPVIADTDGDGTDDGYDGAPLDASDTGDFDGDGLTDFEEINKWGTDPQKPDTDGDGLGDKFETSVDINLQYYTMSYTSGAPDGSHVNPSYPLAGYKFDTDDDGLADSFELELYNIVTGGTVTTNVQIVIDTILNDSDSTNDTLVECLYYTNNGLTPDPANGLHPGLYDTDGDGLGDGDECNVYLTDPLNAADGQIIIDKIQANLRDIVYIALQHKYIDATVATGGGVVDANGRYPVSIVSLWDSGTSTYTDITTAITSSCGSAAYDANVVDTNVCGILDSNYTNDTSVQVWHAWVAPSAIYDLIQDPGVVFVNPN